MKKLPGFTRVFGLLVGASLAISSWNVHAETENERAILNATRLSNYIHSTEPSLQHLMIKRIEKEEVQRIAPSHPVWIIDASEEIILYYQGQASFRGQPANRLVDDSGFRFGQRAVEMAHASRSTWMTLNLDGKEYSAYCASNAPTVVCSLIPDGRPLPTSTPSAQAPSQ